MLISMTGFGNGSASSERMSVNAEIRSVNNRYYEFSSRLPRHLQGRELELKEIVKVKLSRGKINLSVTVDKTTGEDIPLKVNIEAARSYHRLLSELQQATGIPGEITLDTFLKFSDVFMAEDSESLTDEEWNLVLDAVRQAVDALYGMRLQEGEELSVDLRNRLTTMADAILRIETLSAGKVEDERTRLKERVNNILSSDKIDPDRLELEITLLADKMDITEELVRFRSHVKFFLEALDGSTSEGRKLSFLLQEMNREANTISSKSYDAEIAHLVVGIKEELERVREQIQNIE